ncbi:hypothetical protein K474DRAFT_1603409 [Panus rudis PR-1116 ss-1]|nr:hypothetical protein K474DRAFT_1603409 [Panus rudis PR-1116 ss-1]
MEEVKQAFAALKVAITKIKRRDTKSKLLRVIEQAESHLILLNSSVLTSQQCNSLRDCLRAPLVDVYATCPTPALQVTAALSRVINEEHILAELTAGREDRRLRCEEVLHALLSGVLVWTSSNHPQTPDAIGVVLYPTLCSIAFSLSTLSLGVSLRCVVCRLCY